MGDFLQFIQSEQFIIIWLVLTVVLFLGFCLVLVKMNGLNKRYKDFMQKLGNGKNLEEDLENYMYRVERVEKQNAQINGDIKSIENTLQNCVQRIGMVRYNAFQDTGSNLSFTLALLDNNNTGIILNGIYSREMSNIYAKSIEKGVSKNTLSEEEKQALAIAMKTDT